MPYDSIVCVKQVPDTGNITGEAMKEDGTVNRAALTAIFNPDDLHALEAALAIRDEYGGTVTAVCMGPPNAGNVPLKDCLYRGADRAILLTDRRAAVSDTHATSYILSQVIRKIGRYDFVFCGRQAIDGDTAQVGPQCAEKLGIKQVTYMEKIEEVRGTTARIRRNVGNGWEVVECELPVLVTVLDTANEPRPPAAKRVMRHKRARMPAELQMEVNKQMPDASAEEKAAEGKKQLDALREAGMAMEQWDVDDIEADLTWCGMAGSPTKVHRVQWIVLTKEGHTEVEPTEEGVRGMVRELVVDRTLG